MYARAGTLILWFAIIQRNSFFFILSFVRGIR